MAMIPKIKRFAAAMIAVVLSPALAKAQGGFVAQGAEYKVAGTLAGEQVYPHSSNLKSILLHKGQWFQ